MCAEKVRVEADRCNPARDEPRVLPGRHTAVAITTATEQKFAGLLARGFDVIVRACRVCSVNSNLTGRPVFFCRTVARSTAYPLGATSSTRSATTSQPRSLLSIARLNIAKSRVRPSILHLQSGTDRPNMLWPQRRLLPDELALIPGFSSRH